MIKEVTIDEAGYNNAFEILDTKYLSTNKIKDKIFHYIHTFNISNTGKNHSTLSTKIVALKNYIAELTNSHRFKLNASFREFLGHIIIKSLPNDVKNAFYDVTQTLYPDYDVILAKVEEVIEKLNRTGLNTKDSTLKNNPNNSKSINAELINSVTIKSDSSSKTG